MIYGKIKPADVTHARIKKINTSKAEKLPGVFAVITGEDTPIPYNIAFHLPSETPLARGKVRYHGEGVAAVAAIDEETAEDGPEQRRSRAEAPAGCRSALHTAHSPWRHRIRFLDHQSTHHGLVGKG